MTANTRPYIFQLDPIRRLVKRIELERAERLESLATGSALVQNDLVATGGNYLAASRYVHALDDVLAWCEQVETDIIRGKA